MRVGGKRVHYYPGSNLTHLSHHATEHTVKREEEAPLAAGWQRLEDINSIVFYRVAHLFVHLGWVDLEFENSTVLSNCPAAPAKFPPAQAESGRQWYTQISSQPNPGARPDEPPST